jgi:hypothetical protein
MQKEYNNHKVFNFHIKVAVVADSYDIPAVWKVRQ